MQQLFVATAVASASFALSSAAWAQSSYPNRPITVIAPYSAGGDADLAGRNFAAAAQRVLGQTVIVVNKTGAWHRHTGLGKGHPACDPAHVDQVQMGRLHLHRHA